MSDIAPTPEQRLGMRSAIVGQAFGCMAVLSLSNGLLLLYLSELGFGSAATMVLLALPSVILPVLQLPLAHRADRRGQKRMVVNGTALGTVGYLLIAASGFLPGAGAGAGAAAGIAVFAVGNTMHNAGWYALLSPAVPAAMRGAFFGRLRLSWQLAGLGFGIACTLILAQDSPRLVYQGILAVVTLGMAVRVACMRRIPELEAPIPHGRGLVEGVVVVARAPGYAAFCCYAFLLTLATASAPTLFALIEKKSVGFGDRGVVWMGNLLALGCVLGFFAGGRLVDRLGTKWMFLICHGCFAATFFLFLARDAVPVPTMWWLGALNVAYGAAWAGSSIAISTEMLALVPREDKALSTGLCSALQVAGAGLAGLLSAGAIALGVLSDRWGGAGSTLGAYDTLLLLSGVLVTVLVVALGLVPSVMRPAQWVPRDA